MLLEWLARHPEGETFEIIDVDIINAGQLQPELMSLNPNHSVPTLFDTHREKAIWESNGILRYLVNQSGIGKDLYPVDEHIQVAAIDAALEFRMDVLYPAIEDFAYVALGFSRERVAGAPRVMARALGQLCEGFLSTGGGFVGGRSEPSIADFAIAPCLAFLGDENDDERLPQLLRDYLRRFYEALPCALNITECAREYVRMRAEMGYTSGKSQTFRNVLSGDESLDLPFRRVKNSDGLTLNCATDIEGAAIRLFVAHMGYDIVVVDADESVLRKRPVLVDSEVGIAISGAFTISRHLCRKYNEMNFGSVPELETIIEYSHVLRRKVEAAVGGSVKAAELVPSALRVFGIMMEDCTTPFLAGHKPGMPDCMVFASLRAWASTNNHLGGLPIPNALLGYYERIGVWHQTELDTETFSNLAAEADGLGKIEFDAPDAELSGDEASLKLLLHRSRQSDKLLEHEGPLVDSLYRRSDELPESHREWDQVAAELSWDYRNLNVRTKLDAMPVLLATEEALPDHHLARASSLLSIFAHAYWHNEHDNPIETLPDSLLEPWQTVTRRLGRSVPTMNYMDLYTYNWSGVPNSVTRMRLRTPTTGSFAEQRFYLGTVAISNAGLPIIGLSVRAADEAESGDEQALRITLEKITQCIRQMTEVFKFLSLQRNDAGFVDPVIWTHTVATFAMTFTQKIGLGDAIAPSGNSLPIIHYIDSFLGRKTYNSELGSVTHSFRDPSVMAPNHIACIEYLEQIRVREFVANSAQDQRTKRAWNDLIRVYAGGQGFLKQHLKKVFGFVFTASLVGRPTTLLNIPLSILNFVESTDNVHQLLVTEMDERQTLFLESGASGRVVPPGRSRQKNRSGVDKPVFNEIDLAFHNTPEKGLWLLIGSDVVDVSSFLWQHPGGSHILEYMAGLDATHVYDVIHANKPIPADWKVGIFNPQPDRAPQIRLIRMLTLCMNVCQVEFRSICEHKCADDPSVPFDSTPPFDPAWTPFVSPINLMLLLRYFRKVYDDLFSGTLEAAKHYLLDDEIASIANSDALQRIRQTTIVPHTLRNPDLPDWVGKELHQANNNLIAALNEVRKIVAPVKVMNVETRGALVDRISRCVEPAGMVADVFSESIDELAL